MKRGLGAHYEGGEREWKTGMKSSSNVMAGNDNMKNLIDKERTESEEEYMMRRSRGRRGGDWIIDDILTRRDDKP